MAGLSEKTTVPIAWLFSLVGLVVCGLGAFGVGCFWVFQVDARLTRIEERLGIGHPVAKFNGPLQEARLDD